MAGAENHLLVADIGGTHSGVALFAHLGGDRFEPVRHETYRTRRVRSIPALLGRFLRRYGRRLEPAVCSACIDFAGPLDPGRLKAALTNWPCEFTAEEVARETGVERVTLLNDFEAAGYGIEPLIANRPEAFIRLSRSGSLPPRSGAKPTLLVLGAGTGLGTAILIQDPASGRYRPVPGEGGHVDFVAVDEIEYRITQWIRENRNRSARNPADRERVVSGPGLANVYEALSKMYPQLGNRALVKRVMKAGPYDRPAIIAAGTAMDPLCRKALDLWLRCYARAAKNCSIFPLARGGTFLAGGIAAKILPEMKSGLFMREFTRCDTPGIRSILKRMPVYVITDYRIGLYGCASVAVNGLL